MANVVKQYRSNLLLFHGNYQGNIAFFLTQNDGITMEWEKITMENSFITLAPGGTTGPRLFCNLSLVNVTRDK